MKATLIAAAAAALLGVAAGWYFTSDHYKAVIATTEGKAADAQRIAQQRWDSAALFAQTMSALDLNRLDAAYQEKLREKDSSYRSDLAAARAGSLVLRDPGASCPQQGPQFSIGTGASGSYGESGAELSLSATEFLLGEAHRADGYALRIEALQGVVESDRKRVTELIELMNGVSK